MTVVRALTLWLASGVLAGTAWAHALRHEVARGDAVVVALRFTDGEPFAFERYELFQGPGTEPVQSGRTDALGRLVLLPGERGAAQGWRLRAFSADGHGIDTPLRLDGVAPHDGATPTRVAKEASAPRWERAALGICVILGLGSLLRLALRRRRTT